MPRRAFLAIFAVLCVFSCRKPELTEQFLREDQSHFGIYTFDVDMSDSLSTYSVSFYTAVDGKKSQICVPLQVVWLSPSGKTYSETVYMTAGNSSGDRELYRSGLVPYEFGRWTIGIASLHDIEGFRGMGVIVERKDGTR